MKEHTSRPFKSGKKPYTPMGDQRYEELMRQLGMAFAQADDGEAKRQAAREKEVQRQEWLSRRDQTVAEIIKTMRDYGLTAQDLA